MEESVPVVTDNKKVVRYHELRDCKVGHRAFVWPIDHPDVPVGSYAKTTPVQKFDPLSGVAETSNTRYLPGPFAQWSERCGDTTGLTCDLDTVIATASLPPAQI